MNWLLLAKDYFFKFIRINVFEGLSKTELVCFQTTADTHVCKCPQFQHQSRAYCTCSWRILGCRYRLLLDFRHSCVGLMWMCTHQCLANVQYFQNGKEIVDHDIKDPTETWLQRTIYCRLYGERVCVHYFMEHVCRWIYKQLNSKFCNEELDSWNSQSHVY